MVRELWLLPVQYLMSTNDSDNMVTNVMDHSIQARSSKTTESMEERHPELFRPDQNVDRRTCERVIPMKVLSLGISRTGTACENPSFFG
jgi:hypothetical protein